MNNILDEFIIEANELLDEVEDELLNFESDSKSSAEKYTLIFRNFHSLKGSSGMMGMNSLQEHVHLLEDRLSQFSKNPSELLKLVDFFLLGVDGARDILKGGTSNLTDAFKTNEEKIPVSTGFETEFFFSSESEITFYGIGIAADSKSLDLNNFYNYQDSTILLDNARKIFHSIILCDELSYDEVKKNIDTTKNVIHRFESGFNMTIRDYLIENLELKTHLNKSIVLLLYQMSDLETFLTTKGKVEILNTIKKQLGDILSFRSKQRVGK
ncbi:Hpt domain-containing protein [Bacteriovorax sp. Seq25_V]|uniref:Hpt domain-containing protein n=1 Tax=Bacteriovorax sp. Seq25_V TaxID=1201288 RepID=UPI000389EA58|nr:Hpt domain-containing protein [Bacteriovorax sp. Seq25_V]EQC46053.1 Hpt domain protein [Bacteriovorax sp. Seq25_V]